MGLDNEAGIRYGVRMKMSPRLVCALVTVAPGVAACTSSPTPQDDDKSAIAEGGGKSDDGRDLCAERGWYGDDECDTFCPAPDPDCGPTTDGAYWAAACRFGDDWVDMASWRARPMSLVTADASPDATTRAQLLAGFEVAELDEVFDATDDAQVERWELGPEGAAPTALLYRYWAGDTEVGFVVAAGDDAVLGRLEDGTFTTDCALTLEVPEAGDAPRHPWDFSCWLDGDGVSMQGLLVESEVTLSPGGNLTATEKRQILAGMSDVTTLSEAFDATDDGELLTRRMTDPETRAVYRLFAWYAGDTRVGFIVPNDGARATTVLGTIEDGQLYGCGLAFRP